MSTVEHAPRLERSVDDIRGCIGAVVGLLRNAEYLAAVGLATFVGKYLQGGKH